MKRTKEKRGITLIALIITIIVLLILAGVTISMVVGDNGVLKQAQNAKIKTEKAKDQELRGLTAAEAGGNLEMTWYQDGDNKVPIPAGFAVSKVEGENKVDEGLVVIDKNGNEFVWVPCRAEEYKAAKDYVKTKNWRQSSTYKDKEWKNIDSNGKDNTETKTQSIAKYGGFYVARFEAGVPSDAPFYIPNTSEGSYVGVDEIKNVSTKEDNINARGANSETETVQYLKPLSKKGVQAWNFISQTNAVKVSENMYKDNDTVDSYLIDSNAWNYICGDIFGQEEILGEERIKDSTKYGNYKNNTTTDYTNLDCLWAKHEYNSTTKWKYAMKYEKESITLDIINNRSGDNKIELATGASDDFKVYNIYDMAGNMWEWIEEKSDNYGCIRGGSFGGIGNITFVDARGCFGKNEISVSIGFRVVFYVK